MLPISYLIIFDLYYTIITILLVHTCNIFFNSIMIGCFLITSAYILIATIRTIFLTIITELTVLFQFLIIINIDYIGLLSIKEHNVSQININNFYFLGL